MLLVASCDTTRVVWFRKKTCEDVLRSGQSWNRIGIDKTVCCAVDHLDSISNDRAKQSDRCRTSLVYLLQIVAMLCGIKL